jgi:AcrR family transcriptional regulator
MGKVIPINQPETYRERLVQAFGRSLARYGYEQTGVETVLRLARLPREVLFREFQGLENLARAFADHPDHWPSTREILAPVRAATDLAPEEQMAAVFKGLFQGLLQRPQTLDILSFESRQRTRLTRILEQARVRVSLECFENLPGAVPDEADLGALVAIMAAGVIQLAQLTRTRRTFGGIDPYTKRGRQRLDQTIDALLAGIIPRLPTVSPDSDTSDRTR